MAPTVPDQMKALLHSRGISQAELARRIPASPTTISMLMTGMRWTYPLLLRVCQVLNADVELHIVPRSSKRRVKSKPRRTAARRRSTA